MWPSSGPATSASPPARTSPTSATTWCAPTSAREAGARSSAARCRSSRPGLHEMVAEGIAGGRLKFVLGATAAAPHGRVHLPVPAYAAVGGRLGRSLLHRGGRRRDRPAPHRRIGGDQQVHRAGRYDHARRPAPRPRRRVRRRQPGVPARRQRPPRLPASRPHRDRQRQPGSRHAGGGAVRTSRSAADRHQPGVGRGHQVLVQRVPRHQGELHQRGCAPLRALRRRRARRRPRHGLRQAHRLRVPPARARIRRFLFPQRLTRR